MRKEVDERGEYEQAVSGLCGMRIEEIDLREVMDAFRSIGIDYSARDTHRIWPDRDNMATLIYGCREPGCPSSMKFTITHNVITRVETEWKHNHHLNVLGTRSTRCSVCHKVGHNKKTCPVENGRSTIQRYFRDGQNTDLKRVMANIQNDGWTILGISCRNMIHLVSLVPLEDPGLVRNFFFYAPNDDVGVMGKKRLYAKIVRSQEGRNPCLSRDLECLHGRRGNEDLANLVYALTWYTHYVVVVDGLDPSIFAEVKKQFNQHYQNPEQLDPTAPLFIGALREAILIIEQSSTLLTFISEGILTVNDRNVISVSQSLVPNFLARISIQGRIHMAPKNLLCGCWTVRTVIIEDNQLLTHAGLLSLKTAEIIRCCER